MTNSKGFRVKAWDSLKGKYGTAFLATLIASIIISVSSSFGGVASSFTEFATFFTEHKSFSVEALLAILPILIGGFTIASVIEVVAYTFLVSPVMVGVSNYFIMNTDGKPSVSEVFAGFKKNYKGNVLVMFIMNLKLFLWTLLFIVPGIIKSFEYAMIPYILADNPGISTKEAFAKTKAMMTGNKWRLFKLCFSFIGWILLCCVTCGIGAFFLDPYMNAAYAEFYKEVKDN